MVDMMIFLHTFMKQYCLHTYIINPNVFLYNRTCIRPVVIYGGTQTGHSIRQVMQGCNILCATPGRLLDIIGREKVRS